MHRDVTDDASEGSANIVVGELFPLGSGEGHVGLVVSLGVFIRLIGLIVGVARDDTGFEELALTLDFDLVVVVDRFLLGLSSLLGEHRRRLFERVDPHKNLAGFDDVAGFHEDLGQVAVDLGLHGGGAAALDSGHVGVAGRHGRKGDRCNLNGHRLERGRRRWSFFATCQQNCDRAGEYRKDVTGFRDQGHSISP